MNNKMYPIIWHMPFILVISTCVFFSCVQTDLVLKFFFQWFPSTEKAGFQPQVLIMLSVIFFTLFAFAGKALLKKLLERKRFNNKSIFDLSGGDCEVTKSVSPVLYLRTPRESVNEPKLLSAAQSPGNGSEKHVTFETAAARDKQGSVKTIIIGNHEPEIIWSSFLLDPQSFVSSFGEMSTRNHPL